MFTKILIANRGAISCRIARTLKRLGIGAVATYSEADADSFHVLTADEAILLGPAPVSESYLKIERILQAARDTGAQAIHPGYGFLSENADFAAACEQAGLVFIGPTPEQMRVFGLKHTARDLAQRHQVPLLPGSSLLPDVESALVRAEEIGYPVMLKSTAGGGGIGMQMCQNATELADAFQSIARLSKSNFKNSGIFLEKFIANARHIEVQIFGDGRGNVLSLGERDCSAQRRNQKVIEETPAPGLTAEQRKEISDAAVRLAKTVNYRSAGTVEFVLDTETNQFYFLEVNTRLQVEHGVTEEVTGVDLVEWMVRVAAGDFSFFDLYQPQPAQGHSIQVRIYAEDPHKNFQPSAGLLTEVIFAPEARCETWIAPGVVVTPFYDPMLAKVIVHGSDRPEALTKMRLALAQTHISGIETNLEYLCAILATPELIEGRIVTRTLSNFHYQPQTVDILDGGLMTTVQDYPGRIGYWHVGVPPSGPMDHLGHRLANRLLGNEEEAATLEIVMSGPTLKFNAAAELVLTGANFSLTRNDQPLPLWQTFTVQPGDTIKIGAIDGPGLRGFLALRGGWQVPKYLGSRSTFTLGKFGGHGGRALRPGDVLPLLPLAWNSELETPPPSQSLSPALRPVYTHSWEIGVIYGPHGAPDFFTEEDITLFFSTAWKVHYNSTSTGIRLIGPKPQWARSDGGEAGLHPSNLHDNPYAVGAINFTGDMPIILGPDGPSLGGFVCPACIVQSELWKIGQVKPGDTIQFRRVSLAFAQACELSQDREIATLELTPQDAFSLPEIILESPIEVHLPAQGDRIETMYRRCGDKYLLIEYGPIVLDFAVRFRVHALMQEIEAQNLPGILDLTPGVRSLQVHYDSRRLSLATLVTRLREAEDRLPSTQEMTVPSRIVHLPISWNDLSVQEAIEKYMRSVRADAPWCPSNIEFMRRINGLESVEDVYRIIFAASYLVLGLGDVYLGAPVAAPLDPRHRLLTTKYNPARTWTAQSTVGIGGVYMCVYGLEGPGGYQLFGRTVQIWNSWRVTPQFVSDKPWLLRFFDQIRFYPVSPEELAVARATFLQGRFAVKTEESTLSLRDYQAFLEQEAPGIQEFRKKQHQAFAAERERWAVAGQTEVEVEPETKPTELEALPPWGRFIAAPLPGSVWQILVQEGDFVQAEDKLLVLESMKMETAVRAPVAGKIHRVLTQAGATVDPGQALLILSEGENP